MSQERGGKEFPLSLWEVPGVGRLRKAAGIELIPVMGPGKGAKSRERLQKRQDSLL